MYPINIKSQTQHHHPIWSHGRGTAMLLGAAKVVRRRRAGLVSPGPQSMGEWWIMNNWPSLSIINGELLNNDELMMDNDELIIDE